MRQFPVAAITPARNGQTRSAPETRMSADFYEGCSDEAKMR